MTSFKERKPEQYIEKANSQIHDLFAKAADEEQVEYTLYQLKIMTGKVNLRDLARHIAVEYGLTLKQDAQK